MRTDKVLVTAAALLVAIASLNTFAPLKARAQQPTPQTEKAKEEPASFWMERKLSHSKEILAGLSTGDFDKIVTSAQSMRNLNKVEDFIRGRSPGYRLQLQIFEDSLDEIIRQAEKDNLEGAALGFTQLTINCVNCHKQIRVAK